MPVLREKSKAGAANLPLHNHNKGRRKTSPVRHSLFLKPFVGDDQRGDIGVETKTNFTSKRGKTASTANRGEMKVP